MQPATHPRTQDNYYRVPGTLCPLPLPCRNFIRKALETEGNMRRKHLLNDVLYAPIQTLETKYDAFYFRPSKSKLAFEKSVVGVNKLNEILPNMCKETGIKIKSAPCLRVACATKLFNSEVPVSE